MGYDSEGLKAKAEWIKNLASAIGIVMVVVSLIHEFIYKGQEFIFLYKDKRNKKYGK